MVLAELKMVRWPLGVTRKDKIRKQFVRETEKSQSWETNFGMQGYAGMDTKKERRLHRKKDNEDAR